MTELLSQIKILFILTSASTMGASDKPTGLWFEELATPLLCVPRHRRVGDARLHYGRTGPH